MYAEAKSRQMFASLLKTVRLSVGLTQAEMAAQLGVSRVRYNQYERGYHLPKQPETFLDGIGRVVLKRMNAAFQSAKPRRQRRTVRHQP